MPPEATLCLMKEVMKDKKTLHGFSCDMKYDVFSLNTVVSE